MVLRIALTLFLSLPLAVGAQEMPAVGVARQHLADAAGVAVDAVAVSDVHADRGSGAQIVHLVQQHDGVPVWGTVSAVAVLPSGRAVGAGHALIEIDAARAAESEPTLPPSAAVDRAITHVRPFRTSRARTQFSDAPGETRHVEASPLVAVGEPALVYQPGGGALRLAWAVTVQGESPTAMWSVRVDAHSGTVLVADDRVRHEPRPTATPQTWEPTATVGGGGGGPAYRVIPFPFESPLASPFALVQDPAARGGDASPFGWHDTDGAPGPEFTVTTGNNIVAYEDQNSNNVPDPGSQPDGGPDLLFDFAYDPEQQPEASVEAAVTNAFYWTNVLHDVLWAYGFDEPAGNFQTNTYGRGGAGNDPYRVEVQNGFSSDETLGTPPDGASPRLSLFEDVLPPTFSITAPAAIAGDYPSNGAAFGPLIADAVGAAIVVRDADGVPSRSCTAKAIANGDDLDGAIAVVERGSCDFVAKARVVQALGATAIVVTNCETGNADCSTNSPGEGLVTMGCPENDDCSDIAILPAFVQQSTGDRLHAADVPEARVSRAPAADTAYDSVLTSHLYSHGLSDRLTGGRFETGCLSNGSINVPGEQMSEGWGDYLGLMMTMQPEHTSTTPRGFGTYPLSLSTEGDGFRPAIYTTDFAVNGYTYQDVITDGGTPALTVPHGVGFVWASMLWDMTWALIAQDGMGDLYDADGSAGNQIALQLVVTAMKLQPCRPGFVDARDAILAADELLYGRMHYELIGDVFAARGLGYNAEQGSPEDPNDGTADFTPFSIIDATDSGADGAPASLVVTGANPFRSETTLALSAGSQRVTVEVLDRLGRRIATLHDGDVVSGAPLALRLDAADLPSGVYLVRAVGETFRLTERVTVLR